MKTPPIGGVFLWQEIRLDNEKSFERINLKQYGEEAWALKKRPLKY